MNEEASRSTGQNTNSSGSGALADASDAEPLSKGRSGALDDSRSDRPPGELLEGASRSPLPPPLWKRLCLRIKSLLGLQRAGNAKLRENLQDELARESGANTIFTPEERVLLSNILRLREVRVDDVMIPRADIEAVDDTIPLGRLMDVFRESGHSRMPVYHDSLDDPRGMVHIKDLMAHFGEKANRASLTEVVAENENSSQSSASLDDSPPSLAKGWLEQQFPSPPSNSDINLDLSLIDLKKPLVDAGIIRPVLFVPPSMPATDLMAKMQADRMQMALVIDEYGGTDGLASLEDIVEMVVGDIEDEHDEDEEAMIRPTGEGVWIADPRVLIEDAEKELGSDFEIGELGEEVDTLGGLLFTVIGRVPVRGELLAPHILPGFEFEILDADPRRIKRLRVLRRKTEARGPEVRRRARRGEDADEAQTS